MNKIYKFLILCISLKSISIRAMHVSKELGQEIIHLFEYFSNEDVLLEKIKKLVDQGADINVKITQPVSHGFNLVFGPVLLTAIKDSYYKIVKFLLARPEIDINMQGLSNNCSPLILAVQRKDIALIRFLLKKGAKIDLYDCYNKTALMHAIEQRWGYSIDILLKHETDPNVLNKEGKNIFDYFRGYLKNYPEAEEIKKRLDLLVSSWTNKISKTIYDTEDCKMLPEVITNLISEYVV